MLAFVFSALVVAGQNPSGPALRVAIVTDAPLGMDARSELSSKKPDAAVALFVGRGYERVDKDGATLLFAPKLWAQKELDDMVVLWDEAVRYVQEDGSLDLAASPRLTGLADAGFGLQGYGGATGAHVMLSANPSLTLVVGGVRKTMSISIPENDARRARLSDQPLRSLDARALAARGEPALPGEFRVPDALCAFSPGLRAYDPEQRMRDLALASDVLAERYRAARAARRAARAKLQDKLPFLSPLANVHPGDKASDLPPGIQSQFEDNFVGQWKRFGFSDEASAEGWLRQARVADTEAGWNLLAAVRSPFPTPMYIGFGLP